MTREDLMNRIRASKAKKNAARKESAALLIESHYRLTGERLTEADVKSW